MENTLKKTVENLIQNREYAEAEKQLVEFMRDNPDDIDAKLLYGTCRMMQGDSKTAQEIQQQAQAYFESGKNDITEEQKSFWERYKGLIIYGAIGAALIIAVAGAGGTALVHDITASAIRSLQRYDTPGDKYAGPEYYQAKYAGPEYNQHKYAGPQRPEMIHDNVTQW